MGLVLMRQVGIVERASLDFDYILAVNIGFVSVRDSFLIGGRRDSLIKHLVILNGFVSVGPLVFLKNYPFYQFELGLCWSRGLLGNDFLYCLVYPQAIF